MEAASPPIQYRAMAEAAPEGSRDPERLAELATLALEYKPAQAIARKQKDTGLWGANLLAPGANKVFGWTEAGTVTQYRRLLEMGWPADQRVFRIADRFLYRLLSRRPRPHPLVGVSAARLDRPRIWIVGAEFGPGGRGGGARARGAG